MGISTTALLKIFKRLREGATTPERQKLLRDAWPGIKQEMYKTDPKRVYAAGSYASAKPDPSDIDLVVYRKPIYGSGYLESYRPVGWRAARGLPGKRDDIFEYPSHIIEKGRSDRAFIAAMEKAYPSENPGADIGRDSLKKIMKVGKERYTSEHKWKRLLGGAPLATVLADEEEDGE
jgi:hypothetical protein